MGVSVVRYKSNHEYIWGTVHDNKVYPIQGNYESLASFLNGNGITQAKKALSEGKGELILTDVELVSPVTTPAQVVCQGANYGSHRAEAGMKSARPPYNLIFTKAPSSMTGPHNDILCPPHVNLLDYEIELGVVIRKEISEGVEITSDNLNEYIAGYVITNDVSARDVQFIEGQWFKGKSYRTFCPVGPILYLFDEDEPTTIHNLELTLSVNGDVRQSATTEQLLYKPEESLTELSQLMSFYPGDLWLTGTPGGVALKLSTEELELLMNPSVPVQDKTKKLAEIRENNDNYLKNGDMIRCEIKSLDGEIDLGTQENKVVVKDS
ncbi:fumarylacetoacetate hydrolase family protein [Oceanobacillus halotolerans]|uniref:fumarylacetoacetate hydrolase family protein n=1 Tax=Oceanobacillus halotolerans TaxID=2663380 RepID=UPI0013DC09EE|nr:fumarylacetoacetate hydrolase family protein [Oceanobacillus halotolerans]